jgi:hypothetical protein
MVTISGQQSDDHRENEPRCSSNPRVKCWTRTTIRIIYDRIKGGPAVFKQARRLLYFSVLVLSALCVLVAEKPAQNRGAAALHIRPEHKRAVELWLTESPNLRVATIADCLNKGGLAATRKQFGRNYHPYYIVGDFNGDRKQDFAIALIRDNKRETPFAIAIFNGPLGKNSVPAYFSEEWDLSDGGLFVGGGGILAGPFESDNCVLLRPRGRKYVAEDCLEG